MGVRSRLAGILRFFTEARSTTAPNATIPAHSFTPKGDEASIEAARRILGKYADQIAAKEAVIRDRQRVIAGELETRDPAELVESIREAQGMVAQHKEQRERAVAQQVAHTDAIARLQANIHDLVLALPEGVEPPE